MILAGQRFRVLVYSPIAIAVCLWAACLHGQNASPAGPQPGARIASAARARANHAPGRRGSMVAPVVVQASCLRALPQAQADRVAAAIDAALAQAARRQSFVARAHDVGAAELGASWHAGCPVGPDGLVRLTLRRIGMRPVA